MAVPRCTCHDEEGTKQQGGSTSQGFIWSRRSGGAKGGSPHPTHSNCCRKASSPRCHSSGLSR